MVRKTILTRIFDVAVKLENGEKYGCQYIWRSIPIYLILLTLTKKRKENCQHNQHQRWLNRTEILYLLQSVKDLFIEFISLNVSSYHKCNGKSYHISRCVPSIGLTLHIFKFYFILCCLILLYSDDFNAFSFVLYDKQTHKTQP